MRWQKELSLHNVWESLLAGIAFETTPRVRRLREIFLLRHGYKFKPIGGHSLLNFKCLDFLSFVSLVKWMKQEESLYTLRVVEKKKTC